jgi:O-antigen/teichoic acid export membrane protein
LEDKALQMGKSSTAGSFFLLIGVVGSSVILALSTLLLQGPGMLSAAEVGLYGTVLVPSTIIAFFRDLGVNSAITQKIASLRALNRHDEISDVMLSGVLFQLLSGALFSVICFAISQPLANILEIPEASSLIALMSLSIFANALISSATAIFVGFERMKLNSFAQILCAILKTLIGPVLVFLGFSVFGAVLAAVIAVVIGGIISIALVYFALFRPLRKSKDRKYTIIPTFISLLKYGLPMTLSPIVVGVLPQIFVFFMVQNASLSMMGNYYNSVYFSILVTFISFPISNVLFPAFSKLNPEKEPELVKTVFSSSVKYTAILLIPITMLIISLSTPLVHTLFPPDDIGRLQALFITKAPSKFPYSPLFLAISSITNLFVLFGHVSLGAFQTGIGKTQQIMKQSLLSLIISLPFAYTIINYFGNLGSDMEMFVIIGGILSVMISTIPGLIWGLIWSWKNYHVKADFKNSAKIFTASLIASITAYTFSTFINTSYPIILLTGTLLFLFTYIITAPLIGAVNHADIDNLKQMSSGLGIISKIIKIPLQLMQKLTKPPKNNNNQSNK